MIWREALVKVSTISFDFAKTMSHCRLLYKLHWYGVRENVNAWIKSFLSNCTQHVVVSHATATDVPVTSGVPQGTVLGPVLFLIFINDLPENIKNSIFPNECILYKTIIHSPDDCIKLQDNLQSLDQWETKWLMKLNEIKCYVMTISLATKYKMLHNCILHNTFFPTCSGSSQISWSYLIKYS